MVVLNPILPAYAVVRVAMPYMTGIYVSVIQFGGHAQTHIILVAYRLSVLTHRIDSDVFHAVAAMSLYMVGRTASDFLMLMAPTTAMGLHHAKVPLERIAKRRGIPTESTD